MQIKLTDAQRLVLGNVVASVRAGKEMEWKIGGYAGTGKTTLIKYLQQFFPNFHVCAYTGKAANVLRKKGIPATTIHSKIYHPFVENGVVYFELVHDPGCEGFIVDEASMVSEEIYHDLRFFNLPIIFVGDHGQLEPVGSDFNLMQKPDYTLEEIHRNAGTIAKFAEHLRHGFAARGFKQDKQKVEFVSTVDDDLLMEVDQVICAYNKTRVEINNRVRTTLGFEGTVKEGERVMCLKNNKNLGLFNGMQGTVLKLYQDEYRRKMMDFVFDDYIYQGIWYDHTQFGQETYNFNHFGREYPNPFDFAYCVTAHKAQGDEWDKVLVIEQKCRKWDHKRWAYTSASRAREKLYWKLG